MGGCLARFYRVKQESRISYRVKDFAIFFYRVKDFDENLEHFGSFYKGETLFLITEYSKFSPAALFNKFVTHHLTIRYSPENRGYTGTVMWNSTDGSHHLAKDQ